MPKKSVKHLNRRGRTLLPNNPERPAFILPQTVKPSIAPISKKEAVNLARGVPLPRARGAAVITECGKRIVRCAIKKGAITYKYGILA